MYTKINREKIKIPGFAVGQNQGWAGYLSLYAIPNKHMGSQDILPCLKAFCKSSESMIGKRHF